jgi:DNA repair protein RecO
MTYKKAQGIILKKQNYKETDQILTIWTYELGKIRAIARGLRASKSKLAYNLQDLSLINFEITGKMPVIISAQTVKNFKGIKNNLSKIASAFYAAEIMLKMTADEQTNTLALDLLVNFLDQLEQSGVKGQKSDVDFFALNLAQALGFGNPKEIRSHKDVRHFIESLIERNLKSEPFLMGI